MLVFFFLITVFGAGNILRDSSLANTIGIGLVYGILMMLIPNILKFLKLPVNTGSLILMAILISFLFFFTGLYILGIFTVPAGGVIDFGIAFISPLVMADRTVALVVLTIFSALASVGLEVLSKAR